VIAAIVIVAILALSGAVVFAVATERGPSAADVAISYELAWDRFDFEALWALSSVELRDGRNRKEFVAAKADAYRDQRRLQGVVERVEVEGVAVDGRRAATVLTRLDVRDGPQLRNELRLVRRQGSWYVVAYALRPEPAETP
jgi:hypothetical protein